MLSSRDEAQQAALEYLQSAYHGESYTFVLPAELTEEFSKFWTVGFDTREHLDTGDITKAPLVRVLVVPKDGSTPHFPHTALPLAEYVAQLEAGQ
ncbi:YrhB domain-containing protein [Streptomyces phytophilus]|uniref:YrhB domain-containing protein n=1 Tax=Streptomyces phytophilus TaxID=722715 RepID=UPI0015F11D82|nr:YrhB domain-containing protein [Streptomyces phytophilus]